MTYDYRIHTNGITVEGYLTDGSGGDFARKVIKLCDLYGDMTVLDIRKR